MHRLNITTENSTIWPSNSYDFARHGHQHLSVTLASVVCCPNKRFAACHSPALPTFLKSGSQYPIDSPILSKKCSRHLHRQHVCLMLFPCNFVHFRMSCLDMCCTPHRLHLKMCRQFSVESHMHSKRPSKSSVCMVHL